MADKKKQKKLAFFHCFCQNKSKNQNFNTVVGYLVAIYVDNTWFKFHKNRFTRFEDIVETIRKNVVLRKTRLKFFLMKNHEKILPQVNLRCTQYIWIHILSKNVKKNRFFEVDKVD